MKSPLRRQRAALAGLRKRLFNKERQEGSGMKR
jgi:hypothetical protein